MKVRAPLAGTAVLVLVIAGLASTSFEVRQDVVIDAPPERVWAVIVDMPAYAQWNSQLAWLGGVPGPDAQLELRLSAAGNDPYEFKPRVSAWEPNVRFAWLARTGLPRVFDGEHFFELERLEGNKTRLVNRERYSGVLSLVMERQPMMRGAPAGFVKMNDELKARAEGRAGP
jgi:hypothetical protein